MNQFFDRYADVVRGAIEHPAENIALTVTLVLLVLLVTVIFVLIAIMLFTPRQRVVVKTVRRWVPDTEDDDSVGDAEPASVVATTAGARTSSRIVSATAAVLLASAFVATYVVSGTDWMCAETCHINDPVVAEAHRNDHLGKANCVSCHEGPQLTANVSGRLRMAAVQFGLERSRPGASPVQSSACLRCHALPDTPTASKVVPIRMLHTQPLEAGSTCFDCHGTVGHLGEKGRVRVSMDRCAACHNDKEASAACETCHLAEAPKPAGTGGGAGGLGSSGLKYPPVTADRPDCGSCHDQERTCDPCHTLRMPHPERFVAGYHAKDAAFEKKQACYRCHDTSDCGACHAAFTEGHASNWKQDHQSAGWDAGCSCHARQQNQDVPICVFCHDDAPTNKVRPPGSPSRYPSIVGTETQ